MIGSTWSRILSSAFVVCAFAASASASEPVRHSCAVVADDVERLNCYDAEFGRPEPAVAPPRPAAVRGVSAEAEFGLSKWTKRNLDPEAAKAAPQRITARVRQVGRQRDGRFIVTLDNDQVWMQSETMSRAGVAVDDTVTIREASLGSFLLVTTNDVATRVRRVK